MRVAAGAVDHHQAVLADQLAGAAGLPAGDRCGRRDVAVLEGCLAAPLEFRFSFQFGWYFAGSKLGLGVGSTAAVSRRKSRSTRPFPHAFGKLRGQIVLLAEVFAEG